MGEEEKAEGAANESQCEIGFSKIKHRNPVMSLPQSFRLHAELCGIFRKRNVIRKILKLSAADGGPGSKQCHWLRRRISETYVEYVIPK